MIPRWFKKIIQDSSSNINMHQHDMHEQKQSFAYCKPKAPQTRQLHWFGTFIFQSFRCLKINQPWWQCRWFPMIPWWYDATMPVTRERTSTKAACRAMGSMECRVAKAHGRNDTERAVSKALVFDGNVEREGKRWLCIDAWEWRIANVSKGLSSGLEFSSDACSFHFFSTSVTSQ